MNGSGLLERFLREDDCVAIVQDMAFECAVHPEDLQLKASLGNVTAIDAALPDNNPYRIACQPRAGGSTSLIEVRLRKTFAWALRVAIAVTHVSRCCTERSV